MKCQDGLVTIEGISKVMGKSLTITRQYKKWGLFKVRGKNGRLELFKKDEVVKAKELFDQYIVDKDYKNYQEVCEEIATELYS
ncbi:MAG: hypothetical protein ACYDIA_20670 [Candidatus Humimicrobiaceae bacterium]